MHACTYISNRTRQQTKRLRIHSTYRTNTVPRWILAHMCVITIAHSSTLVRSFDTKSKSKMMRGRAAVDDNTPPNEHTTQNNTTKSHVAPNRRSLELSLFVLCTASNLLSSTRTFSALFCWSVRVVTGTNSSNFLAKRNRFDTAAWDNSRTHTHTLKSTRLHNNNHHHNTCNTPAV